MKEEKLQNLIKSILRKFHIKISRQKEHLLIQMIKFIFVGVIAAMIDFFFLYIFKELFHFPVLISNTLSFSISVIYNYTASVRWVFDVNQKTDTKKQFFIFLIFSIIGLLLNDLLMYICIHQFIIHYMFSKIIATAIVMVFNFITRKLFLE